MSCLAKLLFLVLCLVIFGGAIALWHLSETAEFSRKDNKEAILVKPRQVPRAIPVR
jgi:hypothetical protein